MDTNMQHCPYRFTNAETGNMPPEATMVSRYCDDALPAAEREAFAAHLSQCPACARELRQLYALGQALRELPMPSATRQFVGGLQARWDDCMPQLTFRRFVSRLTKVAAVVAVVAMGHLAYQLASGSASHAVPAIPYRSAAPSAWEQVAIAANSSNAASAAEQPAASGEPQFAEFVVHDLGARNAAGRVSSGGRP